MTEAEWLNGWFYRRMYHMIRNRATTRQVRLYMVACCRLKEAEFFDLRILRALETAEWCADDPQVEALADAVWDEIVTSSRPQLPQTGTEGEIARVITDVWQLLVEQGGGQPYTDTQHAIAHAAFMCLRDHPREVFTGGAGNAAEYCAWAIDRAEALLLGAEPEEVEEVNYETETDIRRTIANLLREIFGNPFRPVILDPAWLTWNGGTVFKLAASIYDQRRFGDLPILADALEEAGCDNADVLMHCRQPGEHVRGCWVIDLLLGKE